ncbi:hypothetical protein RS130_11800 [Paraglaciecola aquimarina]|uniref:Uncharacterized protein n=1 Tax=Paraglaciecola aquimarina TaxID=1235557 RepID=A0ABU3SX26_9ALTE|nr:hypothetical protein [Paraglaciecola aquimarina]MDU0354527.1 hypothetical protein [Paraglaciecola aquimarina]
MQFFSHRRACHQRGPLEQQPATTGRMVSAIYLSK